MPSPSVVLDTNIVVSAHLSSKGLEKFVLDLALNSKIQLFLSLEILHEYEGVLQRKKFGLDPALLAESLALIRKKARLVSPKHRVTVASDPEDNKFLECAEEAMADYLVTGEQTAVPKALEGYLGRQCP